MSETGGGAANLRCCFGVADNGTPLARECVNDAIALLFLVFLKSADLRSHSLTGDLATLS